MSTSNTAHRRDAVREEEVNRGFGWSSRAKDGHLIIWIITEDDLRCIEKVSGHVNSTAYVMNHPTPMPYTNPSSKQTLHHDTLFPHPYLLLFHYLVIPCSLVALHFYCTHCSFLVTLCTFSRYLGSSSYTHYLILEFTNASLALFLCFSSLVTISWLSPALSYSSMWLSL